MRRKSIFIIILFIMIHCSPGSRKMATVPEWAKEAVWYQIFPERFWNGDRTNDPDVEDLEGGWPHMQPEQWRVHPWTSDWYELQPWEKSYGLEFYWCAGLRRYGGDLQGVIDRLDYLEDLGINAIYFNPLFESPSLHKYDCTMYRHIDNNFGPDPAGDREIWNREDPEDPKTWEWTSADRLFLELLEDCHRRGIRVIIDGVFNHVGYTYWAFQDVMKRQQDSPYKDWFTIHRWDDPETEENEFEYEYWMGASDLPEISEDENGLVSGAADHVHAIVKRWMDPDGDGDPSDGIDGWRLDVAERVKIEFWRLFRKWVKAINPDAYITGEIWWENWDLNKMFNADPWLQGDAFDAVMNYRVARAIKRFVIDEDAEITAADFADSIKVVISDYGWEHALVCQNLMDSHDVDRLGSQIVNSDRWYDHWAAPKDNPGYDVRKPSAEEMDRLRLIVGLQMTLPGAPMVYYGGEAGMWGGDDPDCRKPMVWPELEYEAERSHPFDKRRPIDIVKFDAGLFDWYRKMIHLRRSRKTLTLGGIDFFYINDEEKVLGLHRAYGGESLFVFVNNDARTKAIPLSPASLPGDANRYKDLVSGDAVNVSDGDLILELEAYQIRVFEPEH